MDRSGTDVSYRITVRYACVIVGKVRITQNSIKFHQVQLLVNALCLRGHDGASISSSHRSCSTIMNRQSVRTGNLTLNRVGKENTAPGPIIQLKLHSTKPKPAHPSAAAERSLSLFRSVSPQLIKDQVNWLKLTGSCRSSGWGRSADNRLTAVHCATRRWSWWHWANGHVRFV